MARHRHRTWPGVTQKASREDGWSLRNGIIAPAGASGLGGVMSEEPSPEEGRDDKLHQENELWPPSPHHGHNRGMVRGHRSPHGVTAR